MPVSLTEMRKTNGSPQSYFVISDNATSFVFFFDRHGKPTVSELCRYPKDAFSILLTEGYRPFEHTRIAS